MDYSPVITKLKCLAPSTTQILASLLIISRRIVGGVAVLLKILAFHHFQIVQLTSMVREAIAFRFGFTLHDIIVHQCSIEKSAGDVEPLLHHSPKSFGETAMRE
jgi:hypothetical protein